MYVSIPSLTPSTKIKGNIDTATKMNLISKQTQNSMK